MFTEYQIMKIISLIYSRSFIVNKTREKCKCYDERSKFKEIPAKAFS